MKTSSSRVCLRPPSLALAGLLLAAHAAASSSTPASIEGSVRTSDGVALPHVAVMLEGPSGTHVVTTDWEGRFRFEGLAQSEYQVSVDTPGLVLEPAVRAAASDHSPEVHLVLSPAPVRERVVVTAARGEALHSNLGVSTSVLDRKHIEERAAPSILSLLQEVPGTATARTGGVGHQGSVFLRGGESRYAAVPDRRSFGESARRSLRLGHSAPLRARADRGGARGGEQPVRQRRPGRGDPAGDPSSPGRRSSFAAGRGRGRQLRLATLPGVDHRRPGRPRLERRGPATHHGQLGAEQPLRAERRRRVPRVPVRPAHAGASGRAIRRQQLGNGRTHSVLASRSRCLLRARRCRRLHVAATHRRASRPPLHPGLRPDEPALAESHRLRLLHARVGGPAGTVRVLRLPRPRRLPEPDVADPRRLPGRPSPSAPGTC